MTKREKLFRIAVTFGVLCVMSAAMMAVKQRPNTD